MNVNVAGIHYPVTALGPGSRVGIWFQGCSIHCAGCMARDTWDPAGGTQLTLDDLTRRLNQLKAGDMTGVTISGGEPFDQPEALRYLVDWLHGSFCRADQDVLLYSGYPLATLQSEHRAILASVDALISEPLDAGASADEPLRWRGSTNQFLTPLSGLGRDRYTPEIVAPSAGEIQIITGDGRFWMIGVPRPGDLTRLTESLSDSGIALEGVSWQ